MQTSKMYREWLYQSNGTDNKRLRKLVEHMQDFDVLVTERLQEVLPTGSGIDSAWIINVEYKRISKYKTVPTKVTCKNAYHVMNDKGFYVGWIPFTLSIPFTKKDGVIALDYDNFKLTAHGWESYTVRRHWNDIKQYIEDTLVLSFAELQEGDYTL